jgi:hypothetical protein
MEPFLLGVENKLNGTTEIVYDIGPTSRAQVLALTEAAHDILSVPAPELLRHSLTDIRPPTNRRGTP